MKITTESGSVYEIKKNLCRKYSKDGDLIDTFKIFYMKAVPSDISSLAQIYELPTSKPEVGKRLYLGNAHSFWLSTVVVSIT